MDTIKITKVTTGKGDAGTTNLIDGISVIDKTNPLIKATGEIDVLNSYLGICLNIDYNMSSTIRFIQQKLMTIMSCISCYAVFDNNFAVNTDYAISIKKIEDVDIKQLENQQQKMMNNLHFGNRFIYPGEHGIKSAHFDYARALARKTEIAYLELKDVKELPGLINFKNNSIFLNRISDLLFVIARVEDEKR